MTPHCSLCEEELATQVCNLCGDVFCDECSAYHQKVFSKDSNCAEAQMEPLDAPTNRP